MVETIGNENTPLPISSAGFATIKREYLRGGQLDNVIESTGNPPELIPRREKHGKKQRGMDKQRGKKMADARQQMTMARLCPSALDPMKKCRFGDRCFAHHSVEEYLKEKPSDIDGVCVVEEARGHCPYGVTCRFGHRDDESKKNNPVLNEVNAGYATTINQHTLQLQIALRKKQYKFVSSTDAVEMVGAMDREPQRLKMQNLSGLPYLAPLTTVGNLPFRRLCVQLGARITCGEMAMATALLSGSPSEWSLVKRHPTERIFGVQLAGGYADTMSRCAQLIADNLEVDFIDINLGCPIDVVNEKAAGCALAARPTKLAAVIGGMRRVMPNLPLTIKLRTGLKEEKRTAHETIGKLVEMNLAPELITLHPRSKEQRYSRLAHWDYVEQCVQAAQNVPFWACGDVLSYEDYYRRLDQSPIAGVMIGRGALMKPWIFTEIEERRHWDISSSERLDIIKQFVHFGLDHWGSDDEGVTRTRRFLLEWLSFQHRYIPVGLLELPPQKINDKPPGYFGRNEMETLLSSPASSDWLNIAEIFLGPAPDGFLFLPKHRASAY